MHEFETLRLITIRFHNSKENHSHTNTKQMNIMCRLQQCKVWNKKPVTNDNRQETDNIATGRLKNMV